jgi:hypothetical protein
VYIPIELGPETAGRLARFVAERVDLYLADVHAMLRLPLREAGIEAGCNFAIAQALLSALAGLARLSQPQEYGTGAALKQVLGLYPDESTIPGATLQPQLAEHLYDAYRNVLTHSFGINVQWSKSAKAWAVEPLPAWFKVSTAGGLPESQVESLEHSARPAWLAQVPTLKLDGRTYVLNGEALYWGTRHLVRVLCATSRFAQPLDRVLAGQGSGVGLSLTGGVMARFAPPTEVSSTANMVITTSYPHGLPKP